LHQALQSSIEEWIGGDQARWQMATVAYPEGYNAVVYWAPEDIERESYGGGVGHVMYQLVPAPHYYVTIFRETLGVRWSGTVASDGTVTGHAPRSWHALTPMPS
jgi:hypothetical protein